VKKKVLIIDDNADFLKLLRFRLEASGYFVISAYDGDGGLKQAKKDKPDLILLDVMMPKMDGYAVMRLLKEDKMTKDIPIVMLTCLEKTKDAFLDAGVKGYIIKPYDKEDLLQMIDNLLK